MTSSNRAVVVVAVAAHVVAAHDVVVDTAVDTAVAVAVAGRQWWEDLQCPGDGCVSAPTRSPSLPSGRRGGCGWGPIGPPVGSSRSILFAAAAAAAAVAVVVVVVVVVVDMVVERPSSGWTSSSR